jgi:hypothetical protein
MMSFSLFSLFEVAAERNIHKKAGPFVPALVL